MRIRAPLAGLTLAAATLAFGCSTLRAPEPRALSATQCVSLLARDDLDPDSLARAVEHSRAFFARQPQRQAAPARRAVEALARALGSDRGQWAKAVCRELAAVPVETSAPVLLTGYYQPVLRARRTRDAAFRHPIYEPPRGRKSYTRAEIDAGALEGKANILAWLDDPIESFFLHVQGSGLLRFEDGSVLAIGYAGSNGRPYRSIGQWLIEQERSWPEGFSAPGIKSYLRAHPEERDRILHVNERYIYFRVRPGGPIGSLGVPLTPGRSVAADPSAYAEGGPAFLLANNGLSRVVLVQDAGSAIRGPERLDLFLGSGDQAGRIAGVMHERSRLYLLVPR